ncbi:unnamed protein product [Coregonus sp. 'balchen']|nr:unnamed protein product [Coregonus sp. 'balchen']
MVIDLGMGGHVLLVSSSRHPDQWIVPGGGMEPEEEPCGAAVREVYEEHNQDRKHRTYVYVLTVTETLEDWEDSVNIGLVPVEYLRGRKRKWFKIDEAIQVLQGHKPVHAEYLRRLTATCIPTCSSTCCNPTNGNTWVSPLTDDNAPNYVTSTQGTDRGPPLVNR